MMGAEKRETPAEKAGVFYYLMTPVAPRIASISTVLIATSGPIAWMSRVSSTQSRKFISICYPVLCRRVKVYVFLNS